MGPIIHCICDLYCIIKLKMLLLGNKVVRKGGFIVSEDNPEF